MRIRNARLDRRAQDRENTLRPERQENTAKLKDLASDWPLDGWLRGSLVWDNDPGILKLAAVTEPDSAGTFELVADDAQLCRWSNRLVLNDAAWHAAVSVTLAGAVGKTLAEIGETDVDT